jgi:hypothetical protein
MILGDEFMTKYDCILHYGRKCLMIRKGKRHIICTHCTLCTVFTVRTVKTPPMQRDPSEESDAVPNVLSAS